MERPTAISRKQGMHRHEGVTFENRGDVLHPDIDRRRRHSERLVEAAHNQPLGR